MKHILLCVLFNKQKCIFHHAALMELLMKFTFIAAVGGIGLEDVAVAGFQLFEDAGFIDYAGAAVVG